MVKNKHLAMLAALFFLIINLNTPSNAIQNIRHESRKPDYSYEFLGEDKFENFNRKMFIFNAKLNKYILRPINMTWASIMPKYGMDKLQNAQNNIEYPKRLISCLIQKDFKASGKETLRFLTNTTIGLAGLYDPAQTFFKLDPVQEDMDQALAKIKVKQGNYIVLPIIAHSTTRGVLGKILEVPLDPTIYVGSPIIAAVKTVLLVNRTSFIQPLAKMLEQTYADPYEITKKLHGLEIYIKIANLDRKEVLEAAARAIDGISSIKIEHIKEISANNVYKNTTGFQLVSNSFGFTKNEITTPLEKHIIKPSEELSFNPLSPLQEITTNNSELQEKPQPQSDIKVDISLLDYKPQNPVTDSMRTALFELPDKNNSIWSEISLWNRTFGKKIKTSSVNIHPDKENYKFRYILQKDKNAPVAIFYPSIGEGAMSAHSVAFAKIFYDEGYSVIIQGSHFQWEFVKSMPESYKPGLPSEDAQQLRIVTSKIINALQEKHNCQFRDKILMGTSFGALTTLFFAQQEEENNTLNISKYISVNPPIELLFALQQLDKNTDEWNQNPGNIKHRTAITAAKIIQMAQAKNKSEIKIEQLPFSEAEAKLISGFILHQKLSDLIFTLEKAPTSQKSDIYQSINNMGYQDYAERYLLTNSNQKFEDISFKTSLHSISPFLKQSSKYKIYHTADDYFVNHQQLKKLREYADNKIIIMDHGSHLGFLYRKEFIDELKRDISTI